MSHEHNGRPSRTTVERLARVTSVTLKASGVCFIAFILLTIPFAVEQNVKACMVCLVLLGVTSLAGLLAGLVRIGISVFAETQMHLSEMLATVLVAGAITVGLISAVDLDSAYQSNRDVVRALLGFVVLLMTGTGSTWGWSVCRRLRVDETWQRLKFLLYGWLFAAGVCSLAVLVFCCILFLALAVSGLAQDPPTAGFLIA